MLVDSKLIPAASHLLKADTFTIYEAGYVRVRCSSEDYSSSSAIIANEYGDKSNLPTFSSTKRLAN